MIDRMHEELIRLSDLPKRIPLSKNGKPVNVSTIWRWHMHGLRGVQLETTCIGGSTFTSVEAFTRFNDQLDQARRNPPRLQTASAAGERAEQQLAAMGI